MNFLTSTSIYYQQPIGTADQESRKLAVNSVLNKNNKKYKWLCTHIQ